MANTNHYGANLVENYFPPDSAIYRVIQGMQNGRTRVDVELVNRAKLEAQHISGVLDESTYPFALDLAKHLYGSDLRVIMFTQGTFHGNTQVPTILPIDLGSNPYQLFQKANGTIDTTVTFEQTREFLGGYKETHREDLSRMDMYKFEVGKSRFFYFKQEDLENFFLRFGRKLKEDTIPLEDMMLLVPMVVSTNYVALEQVRNPSIDDYVQIAPLHTSYRLKGERSLLEKLVNRLTDINAENGSRTNRKNGNEVRLIADWVAHRLVVPNVDDVYKLEAFLKSNPTIGTSEVNYLYSNNYYEEEPKKGSSRQFKALNVIIEVTTNGHAPAVREIQIVDKEQYYINELDKGETSHTALEERRKKEDNIPRIVKDKRKKIEEVLGQIFPIDDNLISL